MELLVLVTELKTDLFSRDRSTIHKTPSLPETDRYHVRNMTAEDARIAALAAECFHQHGITATGVDELSRVAGISKRTLYQRFGSKDGLITAAYEALDGPVFEMFTADVESRTDDPRAQLEAFFAQLERLVTLARVPWLPVFECRLRAR